MRLILSSRYFSLLNENWYEKSWEMKPRLQIELNFFDAASSSTASLVACSEPTCSDMVQTSAATKCFTQGNQCCYSLRCSTYQSGGLTKTDRAFDGTLGLGQQEVSVISQLSLRRITPKVFSHCLKGDCNGGATLIVGKCHCFTIWKYHHFKRKPILFSLHQVHPIIYLIEIITEIFQTVALNFAGGASMILKPADYLIPSGFVDDAAMWCIDFQKVQDHGMTILGG